jgi:hypothetical protein
MASHVTRSRPLKAPDIVHARSTPPPPAQLDSYGRAPNAAVGMGAQHRAGENWVAVPFSVPSNSDPLISRADPADISGLENRYGRFRPSRVRIPPSPLSSACLLGVWRPRWFWVRGAGDRHAPLRTAFFGSDLLCPRLGRENKGLDRLRQPAGRLQSRQRALQLWRTVHTPHLHEARVAADPSG